jgi:hypothetical protein
MDSPFLLQQQKHPAKVEIAIRWTVHITAEFLEVTELKQTCQQSGYMVAKE